MKGFVITGASRGVGRAIAIKLAGEGNKLFLHGRDKKKLQETSEKISGCETELILSDLSNPKGVDSILKTVGETKISALVNNAGLAVVKPFEELTLDDWNLTFNVNVTAPFLLCKGLVKNMSEGSSIVNILSVASKSVFAEWSSYCMSKFAFDGFAKTIREELRERKIRVINIYPSAIDTDIWENVQGNWERDKMMSPEVIADAVKTALDQPSNTITEDITISNNR